MPDPALEASLEGVTRRLGRLRMRYLPAGGAQEETIERRFDEALPLPSEAIAIHLPRPPETGEGELEVEAYRMDGSLARFAAAAFGLDGASDEATEKTVELTLDPSFDWDLDGDPDATDCGPDDDQRNNLNVEICDGVPQGCTDHCFLPLAPEQAVRELECSASNRACAALIASPEGDFVEIFPAEAPWLRRHVLSDHEPYTFLWNQIYGKLVIATREGLDFARPDGAVTETYDLPGVRRLYLAPTGTLGFGILSGGSFYGFYATGDERDRLNDFDADFVECEDYGVDELMPASGLPMGGAVLTRNSEHLVYLAFENKAELGLVNFYPTGDCWKDESERLDAIDGVTVPRLVTHSMEGVVTVGVADDGRVVGAWRFSEPWFLGDYEEQVPFNLPQDTCPSALHKVRGRFVMLMGDACSGSIWEIPLDFRGQSRGEDFERRPLTRCEKPTQIAAIPPTEVDDGVVVVACEGENHILVQGRY